VEDSFTCFFNGKETGNGLKPYQVVKTIGEIKSPLPQVVEYFQDLQRAAKAEASTKRFVVLDKLSDDSFIILKE